MRMLSMVLGLGFGLLAACGDNGGSSRNRTAPEGNSAGGEGGAGGDEGACSLDDPGADFTFTIENATDSEVGLDLGCGELSPIALETEDGLRGLGGENAEFCGYTCEAIYGGEMNNSCSDCGPGTQLTLPAGEAETIVWDRRVFVLHTAPSECSGHEEGNECALGVRVGSGVTSGVLSYCRDEVGLGLCEDELQFDIDLSEDMLDITIE